VPVGLRAAGADASLLDAQLGKRVEEAAGAKFHLVGRSTYYRWKRRVDRWGLEALRVRERRRPRMVHAHRPAGSTNPDPTGEREQAQPVAEQHVMLRHAAPFSLLGRFETRQSRAPGRHPQVEGGARRLKPVRPPESVGRTRSQFSL
jgi:hypothetical protein